MMPLAEKLLLFSKVLEKFDANKHIEFVSSTPMSIIPRYTNTGVTLQYSLNGRQWINIASTYSTPSANIIYFRGKATGTKSLYSSISSSYNAWIFTSATNLECNGKLDRLLQNDFGGDTNILTIYNNCFSYMFYKANTLIKAPELPATTLASNCYLGMFQVCTNLTIAPALPATTLDSGCYSNMFMDCTKLTIAPKLPATTLAINCYSNMFRYCSSLTTLPKLPAVTLPSGCYVSMFGSCTNIKLSTTQTGIYDTAYRIPTSGTGTTATDALSSMFSSTGGTFNTAPIINTTYYTENTPV